MRIIFNFIISTFALLLVSGCASEKFNNLIERHAAGHDTCRAKSYSKFFNMPWDKAIYDVPRSKAFRLRIIDQRPRDDGFDQIVTSDLDVRRVNILINPEGIISEIRCY